MHIVETKWQEIIEFLRRDFEVQSLSFDTWIKPLRVSKVLGNVVYIEVDSEIWAKYMEQKFALPLQVSIKTIIGEDYVTGFVVRDGHDLKREQIVSSNNGNSRFTFDNFVVGNNNKFAYASAKAIAENPGYTFAHNPLFLYGEAGLGKTHLLQAIANDIERYKPELKVCYTTSENFTNELIDVLMRRSQHTQEETMDEFRNKYREVDVLLIDDIQFIIGKESTQEEFFHTFNHLHMQGKQIVISSDKPPKLMTTLESRLVSRFAGGLVADIGMPEYETRRAILERKIENENWKQYGITQEVIDYLANNVTSNIRELEGALNKLVAFLRLNQFPMPVDVMAVKEILQDVVLGEQKPVITPEFILDIVSEHYRVTVAELQGKKRDNKVVVPRQVAMYLMRKATDYTLEAIGIILGKRNYTTVKHGIEKVEEDIQLDDQLKATVILLEKMIGVE